MKAIKISVENEIVNIKLSGNFLVNNIHALLNKLRKEYEMHSSFRLITQEVGEADITFKQVLESFKKTCKQDGKKVLIDPEIN
jgi:MFS superfamily sulfate permease-like transporter